MATRIGTEDKLVDTLVHLVELDYDAIAAYDEAIDRLDSPEFKAKLESFRQDHLRHTDNLSPLIRQFGESVPDSADAKALLTQGKVVLADLGGDKAILKAMKSNEDDTNTAYDRAAHHEDMTPDAQRVLEANLSDERRHRQWIEQTLARLQ